MKLLINGENRNIQAGNLRKLLEALEINPAAVVVEHNQSVVSRNSLESVSLQEGDQVEIVQFVGGGSEEAIPEAQPEAAPEVEAPKAKAKKPAVKKPRKPKKSG